MWERRMQDELVAGMVSQLVETVQKLTATVDKLIELVEYGGAVEAIGFESIGGEEADDE